MSVEKESKWEKWIMKFLYRKDIDPVYEKMICFYYAKCEINDRKLTDLRSPYDNTEALPVGVFRETSIFYASLVHRNIFKWYKDKFQIPIDVSRWHRVKHDLNRMTAQDLINMYEYYLKNNDEIICEINELIL